MGIQIARRISLWVGIVSLSYLGASAVQAAGDGRGAAKMSFLGKAWNKTTAGVKGIVKVPVELGKKAADSASSAVATREGSARPARGVSDQELEDRTSGEGFSKRRHWSTTPAVRRPAKSQRLAATHKPRGSKSWFPRRQGNTPTQELPESEVLGSDPIAEDAAYINNHLKKQRDILKRRAAKEFEMLTAYKRKFQEQADFIREYEARHAKTMARLSKLDIVVNAVDKSTGELDLARLPGMNADGLSPDSALRGEQDTWRQDGFRAPALDEVNATEPTTTDTEAGLTPPGGTFGAKSPDELLPPSITPMGSAQFAPELEATRPGQFSTMASPAQAASGKLKTIILGKERDGKDARISIGLGKTHGVNKGDIFQSTDAQGIPTYFVITKVFGSMSFAVPHLKYEVGSFRLQDAIWRVSQLPADLR